MLPNGTVVDETYRVDRILGSGGMADVYLVTHTRMPRQFALKVMRIDGAMREKFLERFTREVEILATLRNAHIVDVVDSSYLPSGSPYMVMELLEGEDLAAYIARTGPLALPVALKICSQIGDALIAAHTVGVVHRDLKPSNIFLSNRGPFPNFVKVLDFGIAKMTQASGKANLTAAGLMGTPAYMSPEQARGKQDQVDARTDQFALATVLYEMVSGHGAFSRPDDNVYAVLDRVINQEPEPLPQPQLWKAIKRALSKDAEQRFSSLRLFLAAVGATSQTIYQPGLLPPVPDSSTLGNKNGEVTIVHRNTQAQLRRKRLAVVGLGLLTATILLVGLKHRQIASISSESNTAAANAASPKPILQHNDALVSPIAPNGQAPSDSAKIPQPASVPLVPIIAMQETVSATALEANVGFKSVADKSSAPAANDEAQQDPGAKPMIDTAKNSAGATKVPAIPNRSSQLLFIIKGVADYAQDTALRGCLNKHLAKITSLEGTSIRLERSGSLQVVDAPQSVHQTNFDACLEQAFAGFSHAKIPKLVFVRVVR